MKFSAILSATLLATQSVSAHYVFKTLYAGSKSSTQAVRQPQSVEPIHDITSPAITCNQNPSPASETIAVAPGDTVGFELSNSMYHQGPVSIYLGKAPGAVQDWDGSGNSWFKIAEWGASSTSPLQFSSLGMTTFKTTIPQTVPAGEYLVRIEQIALHLGTGVPEIFVSCGQIKVNGDGSSGSAAPAVLAAGGSTGSPSSAAVTTRQSANSGSPPGVSIPGYVAANDPGVVVDIYNNGGKPYTVPGPAVWRG